MKYYAVFGLLIFLVVSVNALHAAVSVQQVRGSKTAYSGQPSLLVSPEEVRELDLRVYEKATGKKMSWMERTLFKVARKKVARDMERFSASQDLDTDTMGFWSAVAGIGGFLIIWIPIIRLIGFLLAIAGLVLGILSITREEVGVMNLLGIIFGAAAMLIFL